MIPKKKTALPWGNDASAKSPHYNLVMAALHAKGRIPCPAPQSDLPPHFDREDIVGFYLEKHPGGWVPNIGFRNVPPGLPNTVGTPDAEPFATESDAFLAGAELLCRIVTGSEELPFFVAGDKLIAVTDSRKLMVAELPGAAPAASAGGSRVRRPRPGRILACLRRKLRHLGAA